MKKIISFFLVLLLHASLMIGCNNNEVNDDESTEIITESVTTNPPNPMKEYDLTKFCIIFSNSIGADNAFSFQAKVKALTGVELNVKRDIAGDNEFEFIFGNAERDVSKKFYVDEYDTYYTEAVNQLSRNRVVQLGFGWKF